jgi:hypothetical protein
MHEQPVDPPAIVGRAVEILRQHFAVLFPVALVFALVQAMVSYALQDSDAAILASAVSLVTGTFFQGMVVEFVRDVEAGLPPGTEPSVGALLRSVAPVVGPLILASLLAAAGVVLGLVLLVVPGLILLTIWAVVAPVVVIERPGVLASFSRSQALVRGHGWQVFATLLLLVLLVLVAALVGGAVATGVGEVAGSFVLVVFGALASTVLALGAATLYFRLLGAEGRPARPTVPDDDPRWTQQG